MTKDTIESIRASHPRYEFINKIFFTKENFRKGIQKVLEEMPRDELLELQQNIEALTADGVTSVKCPACSKWSDDSIEMNFCNTALGRIRQVLSKA